MDVDWFNLPEAFYNNRGQKELCRGGRGKFVYMWIIMHDLRLVFNWCRSQWVKITEKGVFWITSRCLFE